MNGTPRFPFLSRVLHWLMALLVLAMLIIGIAMVASVSDYAQLVAIHKPIGAAILVLAAIRLINRLVNPPPPLPDWMPPWQRFVAHASHGVLYALMFALPLVGWAMLSAADYPIELVSGWHLPAILAPDAKLYATLRNLHSALAYTLFAVVLLHLGAALMHALVYRDGVFQSMATLAPSRRDRPEPTAPA